MFVDERDDGRCAGQSADPRGAHECCSTAGRCLFVGGQHPRDGTRRERRAVALIGLSFLLVLMGTVGVLYDGNLLWLNRLEHPFLFGCLATAAFGVGMRQLLSTHQLRTLVATATIIVGGGWFLIGLMWAVVAGGTSLIPSATVDAPGDHEYKAVVHQGRDHDSGRSPNRKAQAARARDLLTPFDPGLDQRPTAPLLARPDTASASSMPRSLVLVALQAIGDDTARYTSWAGQVKPSPPCAERPVHLSAFGPVDMDADGCQFPPDQPLSAIVLLPHVLSP
jgi:hypothetical protein